MEKIGRKVKFKEEPSGPEPQNIEYSMSNIEVPNPSSFDIPCSIFDI